MQNYLTVKQCKTIRAYNQKVSIFLEKMCCDTIKMAISNGKCEDTFLSYVITYFLHVFV